MNQHSLLLRVVTKATTKMAELEPLTGLSVTIVMIRPNLRTLRSATERGEPRKGRKRGNGDKSKRMLPMQLPPRPVELHLRPEVVAH